MSRKYIDMMIDLIQSEKDAKSLRGEPITRSFIESLLPAISPSVRDWERIFQKAKIR